MAEARRTRLVNSNKLPFTHCASRPIETVSSGIFYHRVGILFASLRVSLGPMNGRVFSSKAYNVCRRLDSFSFLPHSSDLSLDKAKAAQDKFFAYDTQKRGFLAEADLTAGT